MLLTEALPADDVVALIDDLVEKVAERIEEFAVASIDARRKALLRSGDESALDGLTREWQEMLVSEFDASLEAALELGWQVGAQDFMTAAGERGAYGRDPEVMRYLEESSKRLSHLGEETAESIRTSLSNSARYGTLSEKNLARTIARNTGLDKGQVRTIVRNEVQGGFAVANRAGALSGPLKPDRHQWVAVMDAATRPSHQEANGQVQPIDEPFQVGFSLMMHPHANGPAEEVVNCRCVEVFLYPDAEPSAPPDPLLYAQTPVDPERLLRAAANSAVKELPGDMIEAVRLELKRIYETTLAPRGIKVDEFYLKVTDKKVHWRMTLKDADGLSAGHMERWVWHNADGELAVYHDLFELPKRFQGQGIAAEMSRAAEVMYRSMGVKEIELTAGLDVGGYAWARQGYDWGGSFRRASTSAKNMVLDAEDVIRSHHRMGLLTDAEMDSLFDVTEKWKDEISDGILPTPFDISELGRSVAKEGHFHVGKDTMLGSDWKAKKRL